MIFDDNLWYNHPCSWSFPYHLFDHADYRFESRPVYPCAYESFSHGD